MKKWKKNVLAILSIIVIVGVCIFIYLQMPVDLRTDYAKREGKSDAAQQKGKKLFEQGLKKLDPMLKWQEIRDQKIQISFQHFWHLKMLPMFLTPIEKSGQKVSLHLKPADEKNIRLAYLDGQREGISWGIQDSKGYIIDKKGKHVWKNDSRIEFNLPSYRFFFFIPFLLSEAELITYAGEKKLQNHTYDLVYATWGKWTPHKNADQYLVWVNQKTMMIDFVQFTVRGFMGRANATLHLSDYRDALGIKLPFSLRVIGDINNIDKGMHHMKFNSVEKVKKDILNALDNDIKINE